MKTIDVRFQQMLVHGPLLLALDIRGNMWMQDKAAPNNGWKPVKPPTIQIDEPQQVTQIPQKIQFPIVTHFDKPLKNRTHKNSSFGWGRS